MLWRGPEPSLPYLPATDKDVESFGRLFVTNPAAFTIQSNRPHPESGRHYYYQAKDQNETPIPLGPEAIRRHLTGLYTIGLYAIEPVTQCCRWLAIDADYDQALRDLLKLQWKLEQNGFPAALERSRRGAHLWLFLDEPAPARDCRSYVRQLAKDLQVPLRNGKEEGIEIFPRHDSLPAGQVGNAIRGPLGIHRASRQRYWFYGAGYGIEAQLRYLSALPKASRQRLRQFAESAAAPMPPTEQASVATPSRDPVRPAFSTFRILDYVTVRRSDARNHWAQCPSCAAAGRDTAGHNLAISKAEPWKYRCWAGCTKEQIREVLGRPIPVRWTAGAGAL